MRILVERKDGLFIYKTIALIIKNNKLLVAKSTDSPCFYLVGGGIDMNETSEEAIIREVYEETGYKLGIDRLVFTVERIFKVDNQRYHELSFIYLMNNNPDMNIADGTFTDQPPNETLHWIPLNMLDKTNIVPPFLKTKSLENIVGIEHIITRE